MNLLVDVGNTRIKWAAWEGDWVGPMASEMRPQQSQWEQRLDQWWGELERPLRIGVASVGGAGSLAEIARWTHSRWNLEPETARPVSVGHGVQNGYRDWSGLGVDRWLGLVGARAIVKEPVVVIDCGTAITVDAMDGEGRHRGGVIGPGLSLMREALLTGTSEVRVDGEEAASGLGRSTSEAVGKGLQLAAAGLIDGAVAVAEGEIGAAVRCIMTGGDAPRLLGSVTRPCEHLPDLVLRGLMQVMGEPPAEDGQ